MLIVLLYFSLGFIFSSLYYIFQDKIKKFLDEEEGLSPEECIFLVGLCWAVVIPGIIVFYFFKKWINFLEKLKKGIDK